MTDRISLTGLTVRGCHGVYQYEKQEAQDFVVDVVLYRDLSFAGRTDDLSHTINYALISQIVTSRVTGESFNVIEALAWAIAGDLLILCDDVEITLHKPHAPIDADFEDVSVSVRRQKNLAGVVSSEVVTESAAAGGDGVIAGEIAEVVAPDAQPVASGGRAVISVGANLGAARESVAGAIEALNLHPRIQVVQRSALYETEPVGGVEQPDFINAVAVVKTELSARELLAVCQGIELAYGRTREVKWGPRTLDLDLIRYVPGYEADVDRVDDELRVDDDTLTLPHPEAHKRAFVLVPWQEIRPHATIEVGGEVTDVAQQIKRLGTQGVDVA